MYPPTTYYCIWILLVVFIQVSQIVSLPVCQIHGDWTTAYNSTLIEFSFKQNSVVEALLSSIDETDYCNKNFMGAFYYFDEGYLALNFSSCQLDKLYHQEGCGTCSCQCSETPVYFFGLVQWDSSCQLFTFIVNYDTSLEFQRKTVNIIWMSLSAITFLFALVILAGGLLTYYLKWKFGMNCSRAAI